MYELYIERNGEVEKWWIKFITKQQLNANKSIDIVQAFKDWNADIAVNDNLGDRIIFKSEKDMNWFLLNWT